MTEKFSGIPECLVEFAEVGAIFEDTLPAKLFRGDAASPLLLVYGPNGAGKSFFLRVLGALAKEEGFEPLPVTMGVRTAAGFHKCFMYSPFGEREESTGLNSLIAVKGAMRTAAGDDRKCFVILDEPDIGMAEGYAAALGEFVAQESKRLAAGSAGIVLCTHSKAMVRRYMACTDTRPHAVHLYGDFAETPQSIEDWLAHQDVYSLERLLTAGDRARTRRHTIEAFLNPDKTPKGASN